VKEGDRCAVLKGESQIGRARIMAARYRIAAAFIDDIQYKNSIKDIKEGDRVVMIEE
jgi:hypothetical protein